MFLKKKIVKGIGSGIGLASEAIADRKERKAQEEGRSASDNPLAVPQSRGERSRSRSPNPLDAPHSRDEKGADDFSSDSEDDDEVEWALDDAARDITSPPAYEDIKDDTPVDSALVARNFLESHHITSSALMQYQPLPAPVILPQRRPKNKERGFVRAYAPILDQCSGIDQQTFMDFLTSFDKASKASPIFDVINVAAFAVGFIPNPIAMGVTLAVQIANNTAKEIQSRYRRNTFLDEINETLLNPVASTA